MAWIEIHNEVTDGKQKEWRLCFQKCTYHYDNGSTEDGFRFIWRRPDDSLQAARGQARIPNSWSLFRLIEMATQKGWFTK